MDRFLSGFLVNWLGSTFSAKPRDMQFNSYLQVVPACTEGYTYGPCSLFTEPWFTRVLSLERKRTERSGIPFLLLLLNIAGVGESNGGQDRLTRDVLRALLAVTRETDLRGWYRHNAILGVIFTEIGSGNDLNISVDSIMSKIICALDERLGKEERSRILISCHVFPDNWKHKEPGVRVDSDLYPDLKNQPKSKWVHSPGKRIIDIAGSVLALIVFLPAFLVIAMAVRLNSKGPVLFRQKRIGQFGERFTFLKFRSMHVCNNDTIHQAYVKKLISGNMDAPKDGVYKIQSDPRVTAVGRFLRQTSLDEVPQFWNVLLGEMSLVGPRPPLPYEVEVYDIWHRRRFLEAKPGLTGLWQVNGRSRTSFDDMVRLDLRYARSCSLWLDLKILLKTPAAVLAGSGY